MDAAGDVGTGVVDAAAPGQDAPFGADTGVDATMRDAPSVDAKLETSVDASALESGLGDGGFNLDGFDLDGFDVIVIGPPDVHVPDASPDAPVLNACGVCDRTWVCNGFSDKWVSTGPQSCGDDRNGNIVISIFCEHGDTIGVPDPANNSGTWMTTPTGMTLDFSMLGGGTMEIDCVPG